MVKGGQRDYISSLLSSIREGSQKKKAFVNVAYTKEIGKILTCLEDSGFIRGFQKPSTNRELSIVFLKYSGGMPVIRKLKRISLRSKRVYISGNYISNLNFINGDFILSTRNGYVCTSGNLAKDKVGGELILKING